MTTTLATPPSPTVPLTAQEVRRQVNLIQEIMRDVMQNGEHYGKIPGCGPKPTLLQPGAQKLILTFRFVPDPEMTVVEMGGGHREVRCKVRLYASNGAFLGAGVGTCSTKEGKYRYRSGPTEFTDIPVPPKYWDLRATDPKAAQALLGDGMQAKKNDAGQWVCARKGEQVEHDNPADYYNTVEKIAYKRALVSATLTVTAASDIFTQDIEDLPEAFRSHDQSAQAGAGTAPTKTSAQSTGPSVLDKMKRGGTPTPQATPDASTDHPEGCPPSPGGPTTPDASGPCLVAGKVAQQMRLCESIVELSHLMNHWLDEDHSEGDRLLVSQVFAETKTRLGKKKSTGH